MNENEKKRETQSGKFRADILLCILLIVVIVIAGVRIGTLLMPKDPATKPSQSTTTQIPLVPTTTQETTYPQIEVGEPDIRLDTHEQPVWLLSEAARDYLAATNVPDVTEFLMPYWPTEYRSDWGMPVRLSYTVFALPEGVEVVDALFTVYTGDGMAVYQQSVSSDQGHAVQVYNLHTGVLYDYQVQITLSDGTMIALEDRFTTALSPRLMNIDGIVNVRDIGGWQTVGGNIVKQGLLFRGSELDGFVEEKFKLTERGIAQMKSLGILTDMDLRHDGEDVLGDNVEHIYYSAIQYEHAFTEAGMDAVYRLFSDLAEPSRYPVYLHCTYGADRTGTMCYLLLGLLGVSDADLKRDYELTALYYGYVSPAQMNAFVEKIAAMPGENTQERIAYFLCSTGITEQQIQSIRDIFLT